MKARYRKLLQYTAAQLQQPSTWRGIVLVFTAGGATLSEQQQIAILTVGVAVAGMIGVLFPDSKGSEK